MKPETQLREFGIRTLSGLILAVMVLCIVWWSATAFAVMCAAASGILAREWWGLTKHRSRWFVLLGIVYIGGGIASLLVYRILLRAPDLVITIFILVWLGDSAAYIVGKRWGKHKIAPSISPGKSWEGLAASIVISVFFLVGIGYGTHQTLWMNAAAGLVFALVGFAGDLFESSLKRHAGVKDSGRLIPGHGGLFDRVDALIPCAILMVLGFILLLFTGTLGEF